MVSRVLEHSTVRGPAKAVLMVLAHHDFGNQGWKTDQTELARETGLSRRTVQRALDELIYANEIHRRYQVGTRNHYDVLVQCPETCVRATQHQMNLRQSDAPPASERRTIKGSERTSSPKKEKRGAGRQQPPSPSDLVDERVRRAIAWEEQRQDDDSAWLLAWFRSARGQDRQKALNHWIGSGRGPQSSQSTPELHAVNNPF